MEARAIQRHARQSPRKMRLVVDLIRGKNVTEAYAILTFNKKYAAKQIEKTLRSAVANAEQAALTANESLDIDQLVASQLWIEVRSGSPVLRKVAANILMNTRKGVLQQLGMGRPARRRQPHRAVGQATAVARHKAPDAASPHADRCRLPATPRSP